MSAPGSVRVTVMVATTPEEAFEIFTEETDAWYQPAIAGSPRGRGGRLRFDGVARVAWMARTSGGPEHRVGPITVWEPGRQLVFSDQRETEVDVRFEAVGDETRVTLEHRGLDRLPPDDAMSVVQYGWRRLAFQFETYIAQLREREEHT
jgi:hypothetical protein